MTPTSWSGDPWIIKPKPPLTQAPLHSLLHALICQRTPDLYVSWLHAEVDLKAVLACSATPAANWPSSLLLPLLLVNELSCPAINLSRRRCVWIAVASAPPPDHAALVQQHYTSDTGTNLRMRSTTGFIQICLRLWPCYVQGKCQNIPFWPLRGPFSGWRGHRKNLGCSKMNSCWFSFRLDWRYQCFHHGSMEKKHIFCSWSVFVFLFFFLTCHSCSHFWPSLSLSAAGADISISHCTVADDLKDFFLSFSSAHHHDVDSCFFGLFFFPTRAHPKPSVKNK